MITPESRAETQATELAERVFQPGNLVHGLSVPRLKDWFVYGRTFNPIRGISVNEWFCMGLLPNKSLPARYIETRHWGPKSVDQEDILPSLQRVAIILSREKLIEVNSGHIFAIGDNFCEVINSSFRDYYQFDDRAYHVYGIPIKTAETWQARFEDEVRIIRSHIDRREVVPYSSWEGIVANESCVSYIKEVAQGTLSGIPIFNPQARFLAYL